MTYSTSTPELSDFELDLLAYSGEDEPLWSHNKNGNSQKPGQPFSI